MRSPNDLVVGYAAVVGALTATFLLAWSVGIHRGHAWIQDQNLFDIIVPLILFWPITLLFHVIKYSGIAAHHAIGFLARPRAPRIVDVSLREAEQEVDRLLEDSKP